MLVNVNLKKGINRVLIKTMDLGGSWGFAMGLSNAAGVFATTAPSGEKTGAGGFSGAAFTIESKTGQLRVKAMEALNFEMVREFTIRVRVSSLTLFDEQDVVIRIGDVNERPRFAISEMREVPENSKAGVLVGNPISAAEVDAAQRLTYWMTGQTRRFTIDGQTGQISVVSGATLDYEGVNTFMVVVYVKDSASPPLNHQVPVNIRLTDVNEAPLVRDVTLTVTEDKYPAQQIRLVKTTKCMDAGTSGYKVSVKNCGKPGSTAVKGQQWTIHGDGTLKLQRNTALCLTKSGVTVGVATCSVSRRSDQKFKLLENKDETTLCLVLGNGACLDSSLELVEAPVAVIGKKPEVPKDLAHFDISFSPTPGKSVGDVIWSDDNDAGQPERVRYGISQQDVNSPKGFTIDGTTGQIRVNEAFLNYEGVKTSFDITIFVLDDGYAKDGTTVQECDVDYTGL